MRPDPMLQLAAAITTHDRDQRGHAARPPARLAGRLVRRHPGVRHGRSRTDATHRDPGPGLRRRRTQPVRRLPRRGHLVARPRSACPHTMPGPWEWDLKRLVTSVVLAARLAGHGHHQQEESAVATVAAYRRSGRRPRHPDTDRRLGDADRGRRAGGRGHRAPAATEAEGSAIHRRRHAGDHQQDEAVGTGWRAVRPGLVRLKGDPRESRARRPVPPTTSPPYPTIAGRLPVASAPLARGPGPEPAWSRGQPPLAGTAGRRHRPSPRAAVRGGHAVGARPAPGAPGRRRRRAPRRHGLASPQPRA